MKKEKILGKAIEKAIKNGWDKESKVYWLAQVEVLLKSDQTDLDYILFDHDFAKAFFGEKTYTRKRILIKPTSRVSRVGTIDVQGFHKRQKFLKDKGWQYHLQQLVLLPEKDRINYLERFLE